MDDLTSKLAATKVEYEKAKKEGADSSYLNSLSKSADKLRSQGASESQANTAVYGRSGGYNDFNHSDSDKSFSNYIDTTFSDMFPGVSALATSKYKSSEEEEEEEYRRENYQGAAQPSQLASSAMSALQGGFGTVLGFILMFWVIGKFLSND